MSTADIDHAVIALYVLAQQNGRWYSAAHRTPWRLRRIEAAQRLRPAFVLLARSP